MSTSSARSAGGRKKSLSWDEVELLFVKSKVYLHPTPSKHDNICGFLSLSRPANSSNLDIILAFTPENQLSSEDRKVYEQVDIEDIQLDLESLSLHGAHSKRRADSSRIVKKSSTSILSSYSFNAVLSYIYSIQFRIPSHGYWFGSIVVNTQDGDKLPIMFFHDDESPSTIKSNKLHNQRFDPFGSEGELYWGGADFRKALQKLINIQRSTIEPSVYLINPQSTDLRNFAPFKTKQQQEQVQQQQQPAVELPFKLPDVSKFIATAKWKVLETVATFSAKTKNQVIDLIEDNAPRPLKEIMRQPEVQQIGNDFESARIYLAKWAQQVKEEAERSQSKYLLDYDLYSKINRELGSSEVLTDEEISHTSRRDEITLQEWQSFFDFSGRLCITVDEVKGRIFHGGLADDVRPEAWLFLLGVYPWDSSSEERETLKISYESSYEEYKLKWVNDDEKRATEFWKDQKFRIEKDINRTDRNLDIFKNQPKKKRVSGESSGGSTGRESSPETPDEEEDAEDADDPFDISNIRNPHLYNMREILLTYNEYNEHLGYVQGMTDLLSPLYVTFQDEVITFWAFAKFMDRMERNFVRDQSGMKKQMNTLNKLLQFMLPELYKHLEVCQSNDLFFYFRMLLVWFKRELEWDQVLRLWEIFWTDYYSSQFHLFFALSILSDNERIIIAHLKQFDEVLKYMNDLSMKLKLDPLLIRAELLFLKYKRMLDIIDRDNSLKKLKTDPYSKIVETGEDPEESSSGSVPAKADAKDGMIIVGEELRELLKHELIIQKEVERPEGVGGG
ncbi:GTPase-activating protein [Spathaspora sp. JA1]|nr:GTPase-activating protein [Spathaspora sp. JA1]